MRDFKLNRETWDLEIEDEQQAIVDDIEALAQRLRIKLQHIKGEWVFDTTSGTLSYRAFGDKNPDLEAIESYYKKKIEEDSEIIRVTQITATLNNETRILNIVFEAETIHGNIRENIEVI